MILPDINLLLYAYNVREPEHASSLSWWQGCLAGAEPVLLAPVVVFGFLRISTASFFAHRLSPAEAAAAVQTWLQRPQVQLVETNTRTLEVAMHLLTLVGTAGNLVSDAEIAALAQQHAAVVHTADTDFARFPGVRWCNPIRGTHGG